LTFIRYAYPPNERGYCGPADTGSFLGYGRTGHIDAGFRQLAQAFTGAWPYLELIAGAAGIRDPLDQRVVEAYWVGNALLDRVGALALGDSMQERFRATTGNRFSSLAEGVVAGGVPHHSFHVFCIYPWVGLLGQGRKGDHALTVLDKCRIRWGQVESVIGKQVTVTCRPLRFDGRRLTLGEPVLETAQRSLELSVASIRAGSSGVPTGGSPSDRRPTDGPDGSDTDLRPGDWVSLHWQWICERLSKRQVATLRRYTLHHLAVVNDGVDTPGAIVALQ
jgi:hypothetical protein